MEEDFEQLLLDILDHQPTSKAEFARAQQSETGKRKINPPANRLLFEAYQSLQKKGSVTKNELLESWLRKASIRSMSGIAVITSLVKPYMCPGKCIYCPTEVRMPKSYIASEPAAARALRLNFSPYEQMRRRIEMLELNGHPADKIEYIIKGGTWNAYPIKYQYWFMLESFRACNDFNREKKARHFDRTHSTNAQGRLPGVEKSRDLSTPDVARDDVEIEYEDCSNEYSLTQLQEELEEEQTYNETAKYRIIGLTLETRPDAISPKSIYHMRRQGCTRVELGLQAPDDKILELIQRGHTVEQFTNAMKLLREAAFKVDLHFMPDLPGTTAKHDVEMYRELFANPKLRPDMVKIYPNTVIPSAELYQWYLDGRYKPYGDNDLFEALLEMKRITPRYCRISRLIRDIPSDEIEAGNTITNLREMLEKRLHERGEVCVCLRCREIGRHLKEVDINVLPEIFVEQYDTDGGTEYFLTYEDPKRIAVYAFLRLRIPHHIVRHCEECSNNKTTRQSLCRNCKETNLLHKLMPELTGAAFIRELHTYGQLLRLGEQSDSASQHKGMGKGLVARAEEIIRQQGFTKAAIISGVGVRGYYEKLGYKKEGTYMVKPLTNT